jgi:Fe-S cluster assembly scaffold protein SufB
MGIQSFLKAQKGDPDWAFTPEEYFDKEFTVIDANMIELGQNKDDKIVLRHNPSEKKMLAKHLRIDVRENATLDLTVLNEAGVSLQQVFIYEVRLREGASLNMGLFVKGGLLNKHIIQVSLDDGANFNGYGYAMNTVGGDCEIITKLDHVGAYSVSNQFFASEAGTHSQTVFQGMVNVQKSAHSAQIGIENVNLNLGGGYCHGVPEIYNGCDTAKVNSGSTTEPLDKDRVYYLQTRGLTQAESEALIIGSHRDMVLNIVQDQEIREEIEQLFISN